MLTHVFEVPTITPSIVRNFYSRTELTKHRTAFGYALMC
jgi:hypothetical protein